MSVDRYPLLYESYGHLGDSRVITVLVAEGNFKFVKLETCDVDGTPKKYFAKTERVYFNSIIRNDGQASDGARVEVTDVDTGTRLKLFGTAVIAPGASSSKLGKAEIGIMPDHDWKIEFKMTP